MRIRPLTDVLDFWLDKLIFQRVRSRGFHASILRSFHQFVRVGDYCMIRGLTGISQDVPPFVIMSDTNVVRGLNSVGMRRAGFSKATRDSIKAAFSALLREGLNLDEAFARRLDAVIDFPMPEEGDRLRLWEVHLPPSLPRADDLDLAFLAGRFRVSGGNIRNICVSAAYFAAEQGRPVTMADLVRGTEREYRKLGRLTVEEEFGHYFEVIRPTAEAGPRPAAGA